MNINFDSLKTFQASLDEKLAAMGDSRRRLVMHAGLFAVLWVVYSVYIRAALSAGCTTVIIGLPLVLTMGKFILFTGWPFAVAAWLDRTWRNQDSAHVFLAAYISAAAFWIHKIGHGFCPYSFPFQFFPYVLGALIGHGIGARRHLSRVEE